MVNEKERIIKKMGINCTIRYPDGTSAVSKFLVKRATAQFNNMLSTEAHRRGDFIYSDNVTSGCLITNDVSGESFIAVATYPETFKDIVLAMVSHMLVCNATITVNRNERVADDDGNITNKDIAVVSDLDVNVQVVDQQLTQYDPGLHPDSEFVIFSPDFDINLLDKITLTNTLQTVDLKVVAIDRLTYPGVAKIEVKTETRK